MEKKGIQLNQAFGAVLTLVLVAVLVIIAVVIFVSLQTSFTGTSDVTITNESGAYINGTGYTTDNAADCEFGAATATTVLNATNGITIASGNYSLSTAGVLSNLTATNFIDVLLSYTYTWGSEACTASENMTTEFSNYTSLIGLVGTIIFLGLVIGVLVASFAFGGRKEV